jgi:hypothetical protein
MRMSANTYDALARDTDVLHSRRRTLHGIGLGALAAAVARPSLVKAGKESKKTKKRTRKKCKRQIDACRGSLTDLCDSVPDCADETLAELLTCCPLLSNCKAGASLDCFFSKLA